MSKVKTAIGGNTGALVAGAGMVAALALGAYFGFGREATPIQASSVEPAEVAKGAATPPVADKPDVADPAAEAKQAITAGDTELPQNPASEATNMPPSFDEVRREADGTTMIAGRAEPLSDVKILVDGKVVATTTADSSGGFAAIAILTAKDTAQVVSLSATKGEAVTASLDEILLAPTMRQSPVAAPALSLPEDTFVAGQSAAVGELPAGDQSVKEATADRVQTGTALAEDAPSESMPNVRMPTEDARTEYAPTQDVPADLTPADAPRVAMLKSDAEGVSLLTPGVASEVALDTIGYSESGEVQLTGRARPDTVKVRVYLNNRSITSLPVDADGRWRGDLPNVDEGVYTLRLDEVTAQGDVSSRVETPFKRESAAVLAEVAADAADAKKPITSITVQTGATLWAIARDRYGDGTLFVRVFEANGDSIRNPDLIYPGQVFDLPN